MPDPKPDPQPRRAGPPHNPGLRNLIEGKRKWHRPERTLPLPPEGGVPSGPGTPPSGGSASPFLGWHERGTENNPVKAALVAQRKAWRWGSARSRDEYERMPWQREGAAA